ncbi:MAG: LamG-like jellyroll fold domain-containing protein, partial [Salibacteraceae bacterium]
GFPYYWNGAMDDLRWYDDAMDAAQVEALYQSTALVSNEAIGHYPFSGNANDASPNGNDGAIFEAQPVADRFGNADAAFEYDGVNDSVFIPNIFNIAPTQFSVSWWMYNDNITTSNATLKGETDWGGFVFHTQSNGGVYVGTDIPTRITPTETGPNVVLLNTWQHFVFTYGGGTGTLYADGAVVFSKSGMALPQAWNGLGTWGSFDNSNGSLNGRLDDLLVYDRVLSACEVEDLYEAPNPQLNTATGCSPITSQIPTSGLKVHYPFSGDAQDASASNYDGLLTGNPALIADRWGSDSSAYDLNGSSQYITIDGGAETFTEYSVSVWFKTTQSTFSPSWRAGIIFSGNHAGTNRLGRPNIHIEDGGTLRVTGGYPGGCCYPEIVTPTSFADGEWHLATANFNDNINAFELYADGQYIGADTSATWPLFMENLGTNNNTLSIGYRNGNTQYFNGSVDDFRIFNRQLDACEVMALYLEGMEEGISAPESFVPGSVAQLTVGRTNSQYQYRLVDAGSGNPIGNAFSGTGGDLLLITAPQNQPLNVQVEVTDSNSCCTYLSAPIALDTNSNANQNSLFFDGDDDYVSIGVPSGIAPNGSHSFSFWTKYKPDGCSDQNVIIGEFNAPETNHQALHYGYRECVTGCPTGDCMGMDFFGNSVFTAPNTDSTWAHWLVTYDANTLEREIYLNGALVMSDVAASAYVGDFDLLFGSQKYITTNFTRFWSGHLDEITMWNTALDSAAAQTLYTCPIDTSLPGLVSYWNCDEGSGSILHDQMTAANHGSILGPI